MDSFYVYANSGYTRLAKTIHLEGAVTQIHIENNNTSPRHFAIVANCVDTSCVNDTSLPILRWAHSLKTEFTNLYYKPVTLIHLSYIDVHLLNHTLEPTKLSILDLVLHFRKR